MPTLVSTLLELNPSGPSGATGVAGGNGASGVVGISGIIGPSGRVGATGAASPSYSGEIILLPSAGWSSSNSGALPSISYSSSGLSYQFINFISENVVYSANTQYYHWAVAMPDDYNGGTVRAFFYWNALSSSTSGVVWGLSGRSIGDGEPLNAAFGTTRTVFDANTASERLLVSSGTAPITLAGTPARNEYVHFRAERQPTAANDGLTVGARLVAVSVNYARLRGSGTTLTPVKFADIISSSGSSSNSAVLIEGINEPVVLQVNWAANDSTTLSYVKNGADLPIASGGTITLNNNDTLYFFTVDPVVIPVGTTSSGSVYLINLSDENTLFDDFSWEVYYPL